MTKRMNARAAEPVSTAAEKRVRSGRELLEQLTRRTVVDEDKQGEPVFEAPGLYVRLFEVIAPGGHMLDAELLGGRRRGKREMVSPSLIRLEVMDHIDLIAAFARSAEAGQRGYDGVDAVVRESTELSRKRWGLLACDLELELDVVMPDDRVLESLAWLQRHYDRVDAAPDDWGAYVAAELYFLVRVARQLVGLHRALINGARCPHCELPSVYASPYDPDLAICANPTCFDARGDRSQWYGPAQWAALALAAA